MVAAQCISSHIHLHQQAPVVAAARVAPAAVDVCDSDGLERHSTGTGQEGLRGGIVAVVVLHARAGLDLHHAPALGGGQQHIGKGQCALGTKTCLEDWLCGPQQYLSAGKSCIEAFGLRVD